MGERTPLGTLTLLRVGSPTNSKSLKGHLENCKIIVSKSLSSCCAVVSISFAPLRHPRAEIEALDPIDCQPVTGDTKPPIREQLGWDAQGPWPPRCVLPFPLILYPMKWFRVCDSGRHG